MSSNYFLLTFLVFLFQMGLRVNYHVIGKHAYIIVKLGKPTYEPIH